METMNTLFYNRSLSSGECLSEFPRPWLRLSIILVWFCMNLLGLCLCRWRERTIKMAQGQNNAFWVIRPCPALTPVWRNQLVLNLNDKLRVGVGEAQEFILVQIHNEEFIRWCQLNCHLGELLVEITCVPVDFSERKTEEESNECDHECA